MNTISYKGYQAQVEFDQGSLFVKVLHITDLLVAECDRASEAEAVVRSLIDDYLADCRELGRDPEKPCKGTLNVRIGPELHRRAAMAAADRSISLNAWIAEAVQEKLDVDSPSKRHRDSAKAAGSRLKILS